MQIVNGKKILFGVTGGIAAYKAADWVSKLSKAGADVTVVMTEAATQFVRPLTFAALSGNPVYEGMFDAGHPERIPHINLAKSCDLLIIAPATADTIARLAQGRAKDLLSTIVLATSAKVLVFPAMNSNMYLHPATQSNIKKLEEYQYTVVEPDHGMMACGDSGPGRLPEWQTARSFISQILTPKDLKNINILITAGPTHEALDPVRFLGNRSSGKMGFCLAKAAFQRGAKVTLISGPTNLKTNTPGITTVKVTSAKQMHQAVTEHYNAASVIIKAAAVSDYRPESIHSKKLKKGVEKLNLALTANVDILKDLGAKKKKNVKPLLIGFAAESNNHLSEGQRKLQEKNLDLIVINDILGTETGFQSDTNQVTILDRSGNKESLPLLSKEETAHGILDRVVSLISSTS